MYYEAVSNLLERFAHSKPCTAAGVFISSHSILCGPIVESSNRISVSLAVLIRLYSSIASGMVCRARTIRRDAIGFL